LGPDKDRQQTKPEDHFISFTVPLINIIIQSFLIKFLLLFLYKELILISYKQKGWL